MRHYYITAFMLCIAGCGSPSSLAVNDAHANIAVQPECADENACFVANTEAICRVLNLDSKHGLENCTTYRRVNYDVENDRFTIDERVPENLYGAVEFPARLRLSGGDEIDANLTMFVMTGACGDTARVAFRGYSDAGRMMVETDRGLAELLSPAVRMEIDDARVLVDAGSGEIITKLTAPHDNEGLYGFQFVDRETYYFFNEKACMTAAAAGRGLMSPAAEKCSPLSVTGSWKSDRGLAPAEPADIEIAAKAYPKAAGWFGDALRERVSRIKGTDVIVIDPIVPCT